MTLKPKKSASQAVGKGASTKDKQTLHGSLPNHLDTDVDGYEGSDDTNSSSKYFPHFNGIDYYELAKTWESRKLLILIELLKAPFSPAFQVLTENI